MAFYPDEEDVWKCLNHPSKRRSIGVCAACLREKLSVLCPDCATIRPCACSSISAASSSSSSLMSFITFPGDGVGGSVRRLSNFVDTEPSFRRSRSVALPIFKSARFSVTGSADRKVAQAIDEKKKSSFWLFFWPRRLKREKVPVDVEEEEAVDFKIRTFTKSRSVAASTVSSFAGSVKTEAKPVKSRGWYFPSPMKVFRQPKTSIKIIHERSPLNRG